MKQTTFVRAKEPSKIKEITDLVYSLGGNLVSEFEDWIPALIVELPSSKELDLSSHNAVLRTYAGKEIPRSTGI